jgi:hypothetical protein
MAILQISPTIDYDNDVQIALSDYQGIKVPKGVSPREPELVSFAKMSQLAPDKFPAPAGLTVPTDMSVKLDGTWKQIGSNPAQWQFQNGTLQLSVTIAVYVIEPYRPVKKLFELIMTHEFLHVLDEIEVATDYLPTELPKDEYVKKYLIDQGTVADATYRNWFQGDRFRNYVKDTWVMERNRRGQGRDSGPLYERYKLDIAKLLPRL